MKNSYAAPVNQLLIYGDAEAVAPKKWPNYQKLGLGSEQIPDLIRMATDEVLLNVYDEEKYEENDEDVLELWAPIHALRALGQLRAEAAIEPLLLLIESAKEHEWIVDEVPEVIGMIGQAALPALAVDIANIAFDVEHRITVISCIKKIAARWPEARSACIALLMETLERFRENDPEVNAFLILAFVDMHVTEAAPLIERAFVAKCVDYSVLGDWDDVQAELGLLPAEELEQQRAEYPHENASIQPIPALTPSITLLPPSSKEKQQHKVANQKAKTKMTKQSRKKNRKR